MICIIYKYNNIIDRNMPIKIACDIGGVILDQGGKSSSKIDLTDDAIISLKLIVEKFKAENVFIISKAGEKFQNEMMHKLKTKDFFDRTGILIEHVHFIAEYEDKRTKCDELKIKYMIDDNIKVIRYLVDSPTTSIWFGSTGNMKLLDKKYINKVVLCPQWKTVRKFFEKFGKCG